jgi:hypothetical protein
MEKTDNILQEILDIDDSIAEAYNDLYECLESPNAMYIIAKNDARETLVSMLDHFTAIEEYEKCSLISSILKKYGQ